MIAYNQTSRLPIRYLSFSGYVAQVALDARNVPHSDTHTAIIVDAIVEYAAHECFGCGERPSFTFTRVYRDGSLGMTVGACEHCAPYMRDHDWREERA